METLHTGVTQQKRLIEHKLNHNDQCILTLNTVIIIIIINKKIKVA